MFLVGGTLTRLLATLTAVMTVTAGLPGVRCLCPNGQQKLFCHGSSGCCCSPGSPTSSDATPSCCGAHAALPSAPNGAKSHPCCAHTEAAPGKDGPAGPVVKSPCCVKTVVADPAVSSA